MKLKFLLFQQFCRPLFVGLDVARTLSAQPRTLRTLTATYGVADCGSWTVAAAACATQWIRPTT